MELTFFRRFCRQVSSRFRKPICVGTSDFRELFLMTEKSTEVESVFREVVFNEFLKIYRDLRSKQNVNAISRPTESTDFF